MPFVKDIEACSGCSVRSKFPDTVFVPPKLVPGDRIACAEAPGRTEVELGAPLMGASGNWLRGREDENGHRTGGLYKAAGVDQATVSLCNVINCGIAADHKNVFPTDPEARTYITKDEALDAVKQCLNNHVLPALRLRAWKRIDILGAKPLEFLCGKSDGIFRWRGSPQAIPALGEEPIAVPTLHPAFIARNQELLPAVVADLKKSLNAAPENYNTHPTLDDVRGFVAPQFAFDIETIRATGEITMVGLCHSSTQAMAVPAKGPFLDELRRIFNAATAVVGHNCIQFDLPRLQKVGVAVAESTRVWDTMLMQHLLQPDLPHGLDFLGSFFTNKPAWKHLSALNEELYCCRDVDVTWQCFKQLRPMLEAEGLLDLYLNVQVPLARICLLLHETGFRLDPSRLTQVRKDLTAKESELEGFLPEALRTHQVPVRRRQLAPPGTLSEKTKKPLKYIMVDSTEEETPWKSADFLKEYFYDQMQLPVQTHAKTQAPTTDKTAIPKLIRAAGHPQWQRQVGLARAQEAIGALRVLQELRVIASLLSTFAKEEFGTLERIHASFNVHGTASGRLSSSNPNLQNIPESTRYIYVPSYSDWNIFDVDFSSLENRLTAWFAQDHERLERLSQPGFNEHKWTTSQFFDIDYEDVVKDNSKDAPYGKAKRIGHGSNYGMGALKISRLFDLPLNEVKVLTAKWRAVNAKTVAWQEATAAQAKKDGFLITPFGRKRWFYTDSAYTESLSFLPQSTGADIVFRCMIALLYDRIGWPEEKVQKIVPVYKALPRPARLLVQVHDSLVGEAPLDLMPEVISTLELVMSQPWPELGGFSIPVEPKVGPSWGEGKPWK
jgi:DNA polymerase I-like protein with 3'-5' exonuclease and polymerase domains/uracil-DNA glycosylase